MSAFFSVSRRVIEMISAIASSTTERVLENGALKTVTPRSDAASRSIWFVPMQNAPIATRSGAFSRTRSVTCVLDRMPRTATPGSRSMSSSSSSARDIICTSKPAESSMVSASGWICSSSRARGAVEVTDSCYGRFVTGK